MKIRKSDRTPAVEECFTAGLEIIKAQDDKKETRKVPCKRIEECMIPEGEEIKKVFFCTTYLFPDKRWANKICPFAQRELSAEQERMLNPLKASKRAAGK